VSILVSQQTRVIIQGLGSAGKFHAAAMMEYGTRLVGAVNPGKGHATWEDLPVFDTVAQAVRDTGADTSCIFVRAPDAADAILEAADAGLRLVVCITEGIPILDMLKVKHALASSKTMLIGPNCPGIITPGACKVGIMPTAMHRPGRVGVLSRSGTLTYEAVDQLSRLDIGQSTCIGLGGDPIKGLDYIDGLALFEADADTDGVVLIGEIGGQAEEAAARWVQANGSKPVVAYIAGRTAPPGRRMGHAGAIVSACEGGADDKIRVLREQGVQVVENPSEIGEQMKAALAGRGGM
jgi:succinyl-CoA synthetase alpha subunit